MGAAASVQSLYVNSIKWFHNYVDDDVYKSDFEELDKEHDGGVRFGALQKFIEAKTAKDPESPWAMFQSSSPVLMIAHKAASELGDTTSSVSSSHIVGITEFRSLLIHLLAISMLWRYFITAECQEGDEAHWVNKPMNLDEFGVACKALCSGNSHEELSDAQIKEDFEMLSVNYSDTIGFISVCNYCTKFIDPAYNPLVAAENEKRGKEMVVVPKFFGEQEGTVIHNSAGAKKIYSGMDLEEKKKVAMVQMVNQVEREERHAREMIRDNSSKSSVSANLEAQASEPPASDKIIGVSVEMDLQLPTEEKALVEEVVGTVTVEDTAEAPVEQAPAAPTVEEAGDKVL